MSGFATPAGYEALRSGAGLVSGAHELVWVTGDDARSFLDGLLSQDLTRAGAGSVVRSFLLAPQGKLRAILWVLVGSDRVGLVADAGSGATVAADLGRFRLRVKVEVADPVPVLELWGPGSPVLLEKVVGPLGAGWHSRHGLVVARADLGGLPRFYLSGVDPEALVRLGASPVSAEAVLTVRVEGGEPVMGVDVDGGTIPQESGLAEVAVSFDKGCFLGQELVARIHSRGHVNRRLTGLVVEGNSVPPQGSEIVWDGAVMGSVTSAGRSRQGVVGLAMVRREVEPGEQVEVRWDDGASAGTLRPLPLDTFALA